jgi:hypothetical protein
MVSMVNNLPQPSPNSNPNPNNSFIGLAKILIEKANLTRGQILYLILTVIYLSFILLVTATPAVVSIVVAFKGGNLKDIEPPIPVKDLILGLKIWFSLGAIYFLLYAIPEIRDRWNTRRKNNN